MRTKEGYCFINILQNLNFMADLPHQLGGLLGYGRDSHTYDIIGQPDLVLQTIGSVHPNPSHADIDLQEASRMMRAHQRVPKGVSLARIVEVGMKQGFPATVMHRAPGAKLFSRGIDYQVWSSRLEEVAAAEQRHYDKAVEDHLTILRAGLGIDYNPTNIFYDKERGFTFIDLKSANAPRALLTMFHYTVVSSHLLQEHDHRNRKSIAQKLQT